VVNMSQQAATNLLSGAPYFLNVTTSPCTGSQVGAVPAGDVCQSSPASGQQVVPHTNVVIYIEPQQTSTPTPSPTTPTPSPTSPSPSPSDSGGQ
jgi:beta-lactam-binding protein with PASTA domain